MRSIEKKKKKERPSRHYRSVHGSSMCPGPMENERRWPDGGVKHHVSFSTIGSSVRFQSKFSSVKNMEETRVSPPWSEHMDGF